MPNDELYKSMTSQIWKIIHRHNIMDLNCKLCFSTKVYINTVEPHDLKVSVDQIFFQSQSFSIGLTC